jgi:hypothetical protein
LELPEYDGKGVIVETAGVVHCPPGVREGERNQAGETGGLLGGAVGDRGNDYHHHPEGFPPAVPPGPGAANRFDGPVAIEHAGVDVDRKEGVDQLAQAVDLIVLLSDEREQAGNVGGRTLGIFHALKSAEFGDYLMSECLGRRYFRSQGGKQDHVPDVMGVGDQHHQPIDPDAQPPGGWHAVLEGTEEVFIERMGLGIPRHPGRGLFLESGPLVDGVD